MCGTEVMFGVVLASVPLAWWFGVLSMQWLYAVGFLMGTGLAVGGAAAQVYLTFLVGRDGLTDAQTKFAATDSASRLVSPGIAGLLIQTFSAPVAILVNAAGYVISLWNLRQISVREPQPAPRESHPMRELIDGLAFVWGHPTLRTLAWAAGFWHLLFYGFNALQVLFATRVLGMTPGVLGMAQVLGGVGVLASSMMLKPLVRRFGSGATILIGLATTALGFALMPAIPHALFGSATASVIAYSMVAFILDCGVMLFIMPYAAVRQRVTPDAYLGRMVSTMRFLTLAAGPLGALAAGALGAQFSVRTGLGCVGVAALVLTACMMFGTSLRSIRD
jgi:hypothetical protein